MRDAGMWERDEAVIKFQGNQLRQGALHAKRGQILWSVNWQVGERD